MLQPPDELSMSLLRRPVLLRGAIFGVTTLPYGTRGVARRAAQKSQGTPQRSRLIGRRSGSRLTRADFTCGAVLTSKC